MSDDPIELVLAKQANDAIAQGADPQAVTGRLHDMVAHLRANPDVAKMGADALSQGADPSAIAGRVYQLSQQGFGGHGAGRDFGDEAQPTDFAKYAAGSVPFVVKGASMIEGELNNLGDKAKHAVTNLLPHSAEQPNPEPPGLMANYNRTFESKEAGREEYRSNNPKKAFTAAVVGNAVPALATLGTSALEGAAPTAAEAATAAARGLGSRILRGIGVGTATGAVQGVSEGHGSVNDYIDKVEKNALLGGAVGGAAPLVTGAAGSVLRRINAPDMIAKGAEKLGLSKISTAIGTKGRAADAIAQRAESDANAGFVPRAPTPGVPALPLDQAGPDVQGLAEGIASRPGPGRSKIIGRITERQQQMRPSLDRAFDTGTGTTPQEGEKLLTDLADQHAALDKATEAAKAANAQKPGPVNALVEWRKELGGSFSNGIQSLRKYVSERSAEAKQLFGAARAATEGQPVESPTLTDVMKTPAGQQAYQWALAQKGNRMSALPKVAGAVDESSPEFQELKALGVPADKAAESLAAKAEPKTVPDPETLHYMKQWLSKTSRLGVHDGQGGTIATQAQGALNVWGKVRSELPEVWQQADEAFSKKSRVIDALNMGRDLMRTQLNPSGNKALHTSLDAIEKRFAEMSPEEQQAARVGMQSSVTDWLRSGGSAKTLTTQLQEPTSALSRKIALATGDASAPQRLAAALTPRPLAKLAAPELPKQAQAAGRGLDILRHGVSAPSTAPERSLAVLDRDAAAMAPDERAALQKAAAQAVRGEAAGSSAKTPSRIYGAPGSERARQVEYAFPDKAKAADFQKQVSAWDAIQEQANRLLGNSRTAARGAENAAATPSPSVTEVVRHPLRAIGSVVKGNDAAKQRIAREKLDAAIADFLTGPDISSIPNAQLVSRLRRTLAARTPYIAPIALAGGATAR